MEEGGAASVEQFLAQIRTHFNVIHKDDFLSLTLINPNLDLDIFKELKNTFRKMTTIRRQEIVIIESVNFDDELLEMLAEALPESLEELSLDFTGCESLRGETFPHLFQRISMMSLKKLKLDLGQVYDVNDLVIEGLSLLLQELEDLEEFYLDLYEVDRVTEEGYILLADSLSSLPKLKNLHLDFSAYSLSIRLRNPNLTEDNLEMFFSSISAENMQSFTFRILEIDHIGGGSFYKLEELIANMKQLEYLNVTISTFSNLNHAAICEVFKRISTSSKLRQLILNISNTKLPEKALSFLHVPDSLKTLSIDLSCNESIKDSDILNLIRNIKNLSKLNLNVDFCSRVTEDSLQELTELYLKNGKCLELELPDRKYSENFLKHLMKYGLEAQNLLKIHIEEPCILQQKQWEEFQEVLRKKLNNVAMIQEMQASNRTQSEINSVLSVMN